MPRQGSKLECGSAAALTARVFVTLVRVCNSQWLSYTNPDTADQVQFRALCEACDELCHVKGIAPRKL